MCCICSIYDTSCDVPAPYRTLSVLYWYTFSQYDISRALPALYMTFNVLCLFHTWHLICFTGIPAQAMTFCVPSPYRTRHVLYLLHTWLYMFCTCSVKNNSRVEPVFYMTLHMYLLYLFCTWNLICCTLIIHDTPCAMPVSCFMWWTFSIQDTPYIVPALYMALHVLNVFPYMTLNVLYLFCRWRFMYYTCSIQETSSAVPLYT